MLAGRTFVIISSLDVAVLDVDLQLWMIRTLESIIITVAKCAELDPPI